METEGSEGTEHVKQGDLRDARRKMDPKVPPPQGVLQAAGSRLHAGVRAPIVATKPGNAGGAKGCRKVET